MEFNQGDLIFCLTVQLIHVDIAIDTWLGMIVRGKIFSLQFRMLPFYSIDEVLLHN